MFLNGEVGSVAEREVAEAVDDAESSIIMSVVARRGAAPAPGTTCKGLDEEDEAPPLRVGNCFER